MHLSPDIITSIKNEIASYKKEFAQTKGSIYFWQWIQAVINTSLNSAGSAAILLSNKVKFIPQNMEYPISCALGAAISGSCLINNGEKDYYKNNESLLKKIENILNSTTNETDSLIDIGVNGGSIQYGSTSSSSQTTSATNNSPAAKSLLEKILRIASTFAYATTYGSSIALTLFGNSTNPLWLLDEIGNTLAKSCSLVFARLAELGVTLTLGTMCSVVVLVAQHYIDKNQENLLALENKLKNLLNKIENDIDDDTHAILKHANSPAQTTDETKPKVNAFTRFCSYVSKIVKSPIALGIYLQSVALSTAPIFEKMKAAILGFGTGTFYGLIMGLLKATKPTTSKLWIKTLCRAAALILNFTTATEFYALYYSFVNGLIETGPIANATAIAISSILAILIGKPAFYNGLKNNFLPQTKNHDTAIASTTEAIKKPGIFSRVCAFCSDNILGTIVNPLKWFKKCRHNNTANDVLPSTTSSSSAVIESHANVQCSTTSSSSSATLPAKTKGTSSYRYSKRCCLFGSCCKNRESVQKQSQQEDPKLTW